MGEKRETPTPGRMVHVLMRTPLADDGETWVPATVVAVKNGMLYVAPCIGGAVMHDRLTSREWRWPPRTEPTYHEVEE